MIAPPDHAASRARVLLVTGLSGAGKSSALKVLEDLGYEAVDNLPVSLLPRLVDPVEEARPLAIGIDTRTRGFDPAAVLDVIDQMRGVGDRDLRLLFFDCSGEELARRFSETRRRHPLALDRPVADGIAHERGLLEPLRRVADHIVDTSTFSSHQLRRLLGETFALERSAEMTLTIMSFGFARGLPRDADLVFDMRFLRNPHWVEDLRPLSGEDAEVGDFVAADEAFLPAFDRIRELTLSLLPLYKREGKSYLVIAFGCTGGQHRSVYTARRMAESFRGEGQAVTVFHRDVVMRERPSTSAVTGV